MTKCLIDPSKLEALITRATKAVIAVHLYGQPADIDASYRDLTYLVTFGVQLLMYLTPVIYPVSAVPANYQWLASLNPLVPVLMLFTRVERTFMDTV